MKINQWTLGLAAVGVVSLASAVNAEEKMNSLQTALSSTTISGYVDTSVNWNDNNGANVAGTPFSSNKENGFNLNVVKLSLEKAMDESEWASGYKVDLLFGPNAVNYNSSFFGSSQSLNYSGSDFGVKQAYVALRTPVGNGIDWKVGVFDSIIGYETFDAGNNPNFTRSLGYSIEPTQMTGILGTYRISDLIAVAAGMANVETAGINDKDQNEWDKSWMGSVALTAPEDMGFLSGSTLYGGLVLGSAQDQDNYYVGCTLNTPVANLKVGAAFDWVTDMAGVNGDDAWALALYASYQASEKLSLHGRAEQIDYKGGSSDVTSFTGTVQYDLWQNVISRAEARYDVAKQGEDALGIYANLIYKF